MTLWKKIVCLGLIINPAGSVLAQKRQLQASDPNELPKQIRRFAPTILTGNTTALSAKDRLALRKIIAAARLLDPLYLRQIWTGNEELKKSLDADRRPIGRMLLHYFLINDGPWSQLDENQPFIDDVPPRPAYANLYPGG